MRLQVKEKVIESFKIDAGGGVLLVGYCNRLH